METLIVLTALVCGAIAAPALHEQRLEDVKLTQQFLEDVTQRQKKSPAGNNEFRDFSNAEITPGTFDFDSFPETARSLHFKKPLIVKKKVGYHLYRNSEEEKEQATSRESCKERVKVKTCDEKFIPKSSDSMRATTIEDFSDHVMSEDEMKHSLKMAKEAIANLERDLKKIEQKPGATISQRKHDDVDAQIHEDIDTARQVLEHIHKNFGDLESMSIHTTTAKDSDSLQNVHLTIAKTEEEKMAQWKEAMKNIQKNTEIARNIEDSFKSASHDLSLNDFQMAQSSNIDENFHTPKVLNEMQTENSELTDKSQDKSKQCDNKLHGPKLAHNQDEGHKLLIDDMNGSASTIIASNTDGKIDNPLRNDNHAFEDKSPIQIFGPLDKFDNQPQTNRNSDDTFGGEPQFDLKHPTNSMRKIENHSDKELNIDNTEEITTGNSNPISLPNAAKTTESDCMDTIGNNNSDNTKTNEPENINALIKSATNMDNSNLNANLEDNLHEESHKTVDTAGSITPNQFMSQTRHNFIDAMTEETQNVEHAIVKPFDTTSQFQGKMRQGQQIMSKSELTNQDKETFSTNLKPINTESNAELKSAATDNIPTQPSNHAFNMRWSSDQNKNNKQTASDKELDNFSSDLRSRVPSLNTHFMNGPHMTSSMTSASDFDTSSTHAHIHTSQGNKMHSHMMHGKSPETNNIAQPNFNMNMRDATGNFGPENAVHWTPTHENARTAYGPMTAPASGAGSSAVGLFPNANVGGCSIPLLLSCSPSVTSGSLAKALPAGYASSAYRTEDEFAFFPNKREVKKSKEIMDTTADKMHTNMKQNKPLDKQ